MVCKWKAALGALFATGICAWSLAYGQATGNDPRGASQIALAVEDAPPVPSRIVQPINEARLVQLRGNTHPSARSEFDRGPVDPQLPMQRMVLLLKRSPEQEAALEEFMARQLDPKSPDFHHWLEPADFGRIYGPSEADVAAVTNWLQNQDFTVDKVSNGRVFIEFSGTAAPSVTLSAKSLTFASTAKGTLSAVQTVTLTNAGTSTLYLTGITLTGTGASSFIELNTCAPTQAPATSCAIYVGFDPTTTGAFTASLNITDNGSASPQMVALTGTGH